MRKYARWPWEIIKWCLYAPFSAALVFFVVGLFTTQLAVKTAAAAAVGLFFLLIPLIFENIRLDLDETGRLTYYNMGRQKYSFFLPECKTQEQHTAEKVFFTSPDIYLTILEQKGGAEHKTKLDCSPLGMRRFMRMFADIRIFTGEAEPPTVAEETATDTAVTPESSLVTETCTPAEPDAADVLPGDPAALAAPEPSETPDDIPATPPPVVANTTSLSNPEVSFLADTNTDKQANIETSADASPQNEEPGETDILPPPQDAAPAASAENTIPLSVIASGEAAPPANISEQMPEQQTEKLEAEQRNVAVQADVTQDSPQTAPAEDSVTSDSPNNSGKEEEEKTSSKNQQGQNKEPRSSESAFSPESNLSSKDLLAWKPMERPKPEEQTPPEDTAK